MHLRPLISTPPGPGPTPSVRHEGSWLLADLGAPHALLSWAVTGGGRTHSQQVAWYQVRDHELRPPVDPEEFLARRLAEQGLSGAVGLLTSADLGGHVAVRRDFGETWAVAVATVGLGNALRIGDEPGPNGRIGTINLLCTVSHPLTFGAELEALSLMSEARTAAVLDHGVASRRSGQPATGTGTDCLVLASPEPGERLRYAGKHTALGHVLGSACLAAVAASVRAWQASAAARGLRPGDGHG